MRSLIYTVFILTVSPAYSQWRPNLSRQYSIEKRDQVIDFDGSGKFEFNEGEVFIQIRSVSSCGLPVRFQSSNPSVAVVRRSKLIIKSAGVATIKATQGGNNYFKPALEVNRKVISNNLRQVIDFENVNDLPLADTTLNLFATCTSGLPVKFSSVSSNVRISGNKITLLREGEVVIKANQSGNKLFLPAESTMKFHILPSGVKEEVNGVKRIAGMENYTDETLASEEESSSTRMFDLFPNPVRKKVTIKFKNIFKNTEVFIVDSKGLEVYNRVYNETKEMEIDTGALAAGLYTVIVKNQRGLYKKKFVKI